MQKIVTEQVVEIDNPTSFQSKTIFESIIKQGKKLENKYIIKCNLIKSTRSKLFFHLVCLENIEGIIKEPFIPPSLKSKHAPHSSSKNISCLIIPTGIGARFGGYAGDANPLAKLFAKQNKYLLTHPNVVNGAVLTDIPDNLIYLEGFLLDQFLLGKISLSPSKNNKIGVLFDKGITDKRLEYEINVLNATKAFYGCEITTWTTTAKPLKIKPTLNEGFSSGSIENIESLIDSALHLKSAGVTTIAICCAIPDLELNKKYSTGLGIDPIGGIESMISRTVSAITGLVSAHAPVLISEEQVDYKNISPLSASEYIAQTFLPSVISGLRFAPQIKQQIRNQKSEIRNNEVSKIIVPYNAFGSLGVLYSNELFKNVVLVNENKTCLNVNPKHINTTINKVNSYKDLIAAKTINESGIDMDVFKRPIESITKSETSPLIDISSQR